MVKSEEMKALRDEVGQLLFGRSHTESALKHKCVTCGGTADKFTDALSQKEYSLSGMCQVCQDGVFDDYEWPPGFFNGD